MTTDVIMANKEEFLNRCRKYIHREGIDKLLDYVLHTPADGYRSATSVESIKALIAKNKEIGY